MLKSLRIEPFHPGNSGPPYRVLLDGVDIADYITGISITFDRPGLLPEATLKIEPSRVEIDAAILARLEAHVRDTGGGVNDYWSRFLSALRGGHDEKGPLVPYPGPTLPDYGSSGNYDHAPFVFTPRTEHRSATGEVYALKEAGRALLADLDSQPDWAIEWGPDRDVVERFRALVEPKGE